MTGLFLGMHETSNYLFHRFAVLLTTTAITENKSRNREKEREPRQCDNHNWKISDEWGA